MFARTIALALLVSSSALAQQGVLVRLLDGRTGKPITKAQVTITTYHDYAFGQVQATDAGNDYLVSIRGEASIGLGNVSKSRSAWNEYELCASGESLKPLFSVADIRERGIVAPNECSSKIRASPSRGAVIFFVRPRTIWEKIRDYHFPG